jgi:hypothetical protein
MGIAKCPHLPQTNRPSATAAIGLNSSPEAQYGHRTMGIVSETFITDIFFALILTAVKFYLSTITQM